ncbi:unnamed protein product, partial [marine sediment metagenome]
IAKFILSEIASLSLTMTIRTWLVMTNRTWLAMTKYLFFNLFPDIIFSII